MRNILPSFLFVAFISFSCVGCNSQSQLPKLPDTAKVLQENGTTFITLKLAEDSNIILPARKYTAYYSLFSELADYFSERRHPTIRQMTKIKELADAIDNVDLHTEFAAIEDKITADDISNADSFCDILNGKMVVLAQIINAFPENKNESVGIPYVLDMFRSSSDQRNMILELEEWFPDLVFDYPEEE